MRILGFVLIAAAIALGVAGALGELPTSIASSRDALRRIVQGQCVAHLRERRDPAPCLRLELAPSGAGYALLADRKGGAHLLLIPTETVSGIESDELERADAPDYFAGAWAARTVLAARAGRPLPRTAVGLAVNPQRSRSQDQLHIHIECLRPEVAQALASDAAQLTDHWRSLVIEATPFEARRLDGEDLPRPTPFEILAADPPEPEHARGDFTLVLAGMQYANGPGFVLLAGTHRAGELLLDSRCAVAAG